MDNLDTITNQMQRLEQTISREQSYISKHGDKNDANPDKQWNQYKESAGYNLKKWDMLKAKRDKLKESN